MNFKVLLPLKKLMEVSYKQVNANPETSKDPAFIAWGLFVFGSDSLSTSRGIFK